MGKSTFDDMIKKFLLKCIKFYQEKSSPARPPVCRFYPTCSEYAKMAIEIHGAAKGGLLTLYRILRCNPLCKGGFDPVPEKKRKNSF